jgi:hypothetical protein
MRLIVHLAAAAALGVLALAPPAFAGLWTWTLYEDRASLALANEIPDSTSLAAVLECVPGSGQAKVSIFPSQGRSRTPVVSQYRTSDTAFVEFVRTGRLSFRNEAGSGEIYMGPQHRAKLARFSRLCGA